MSVQITPPSGTVPPGTFVTIDTNVPSSVVYYTTDRSDPLETNPLVHVGDAPITFPVVTDTIVRYRAVDRRAQYAQQSRTYSAQYSVSRKNPLESFRDTAHSYRILIRSIVDSNFYQTENSWITPVGDKVYTYAFVNREPFPVYIRATHNGIDVFTLPVYVGVGQTYEIPILPAKGLNVIVIGTKRAAGTGIYDVSLYDIDVYA